MNLAEIINEALLSGKVNHSNIPDFVRSAVIRLLNELESVEQPKEKITIKEIGDKERKLIKLKESLMNGDINLEEYLELRKLLEKNKIS